MYHLRFSIKPVLKKVKNPLYPLLSLAILPCLAWASVMPDYEWTASVTEGLSAPTKVALDRSENIYVTESSYNRLSVYREDRTLLRTLYGLEKPVGIAVSRSGKVYVGLSGTGSVDVFSPDLVQTGSLGSGPGEFSEPNDIAVDIKDTVYVVDSGRDRVMVYRSDGSFERSFGISGSGQGQLHKPLAISIGMSTGELIITDKPIVDSVETARVQVFTSGGTFLRSFGQYGIEPGQIANSNGLASDSMDRYYITNTRNHTVNVFENSGTYLGSIYDPVYPIRIPGGIALSRKNRLYIADSYTSSVEIYEIKDMSMSVPLGKETFGYSATAIPVFSSTASLSKPVGAGQVTTGGKKLTVTIGLNMFSGKVDLYGAYRSSREPGRIYLLHPGGSAFSPYPLSEILASFENGTPPAGALPWRSAVSETVNELLLDIDSSELPSAVYTIYLLAAPPGTLEDFVLWHTVITFP